MRSLRFWHELDTFPELYVILLGLALLTLVLLSGCGSARPACWPGCPHREEPVPHLDGPFTHWWR